jgi:hypothetical protein
MQKTPSLIADRRQWIPLLALLTATKVHESKKERCMKKLALLALAAGTISTSIVWAQNSAPPSYKGDPDVYKVIFEDANFRVIVGTRKAGQKDKAHSHPLPGIIYNVNDCKNRIYEANGKERLADNKAGTAAATPITASHRTENIGTSDCVQVFVEKK